MGKLRASSPGVGASGNDWSKPSVLQLLRGASPAFIVDPFVYFRVVQWRANESEILERITSARLGQVVIVRSAAAGEDADKRILPGEFLSVPNVQVAQRKTLVDAVEQVLASYARSPLVSGADEHNGCIIQSQVTTPLWSGVALSRDPTCRGPYLLVEFDAQGSKTSVVTAGEKCERAVILRSVSDLGAPWSLLERAMRAVESVLGESDLIVEFALTADSVVHVFQARRQLDAYGSDPAKDRGVIRWLRSVRRSLKRRWRPGVLSDMADWNPAEMLGSAPGPLDISLYANLVTNSTWAEGRVSLGYADPRPRRLMSTIGAKPYIDVRASFASLAPASLRKSLQEKLVEDRLAYLVERPELHDKVELQVLFTTADLGHPRRTTALLERGFAASEVAEIDAALKVLTRGVLTRAPELSEFDLQCGQQLRSALESAKRPRSLVGRLSEIRRLLQVARRLGVSAFTRQARMAFIAADLLEQAQRHGIVDALWLRDFYRSQKTIVNQVADAIHRLSRSQLSRAEFDRQFGHLRARTYDITSPRYDSLTSVPGAALDGVTGGDDSPPVQAPVALDRALEQEGLGVSGAELLSFAARSISGREQLKFLFSAALSECLERIAVIGIDLGFSREELRWLALSDLDTLATYPPAECVPQLRARISRRHAAWELRNLARLPPIVVTPEDLVAFRIPKLDPTFIGNGVVRGPIVREGEIRTSGARLAKAIVVLEAADPGYDWIFSAGIAGLVTCYGGSVSHMAVRCAQLGIAAAIGCGSDMFAVLERSSEIILDCAQRQIVALGRRGGL